MNREILDAIEEQTDLRYDSLADAAGWYGTTTAWREDFTANWNSTGPKRAVKRQLNRDKEAEEMAKAKIKIKVSDSGIVTLAASGDGYATLNALVEVLAATICEASPNWDFAEIMTDAAVNRLYDLVDDGTRKKVIRRGEYLLQPILTLPSGTELRGGQAGSAVKNLTLHTAVNAGQEFAIGSAYSDYIEAEIWADPGGSLQITAGDALTYYRQDDAGNRTKVGVFYAEKPTRTKRNSYKVTAYDTMSKLDADFSGWLHANQAQFPKTIWQLVQLACQRAGVTLASSSLPINGSYSVQAFYADDLTCRQIISWAAEAAGCYAHMNADGKLQFLTYTDKRSTAKITPDGASNSTAYYADSLSYEDYTVKAIEKVQIRQSDSDVGVIYPDSTTATNTYAVQGNLLLTTGTEANLKTVAQNLYNVLKSVTYTPCKVAVPSGSGLACGQIVHVKDARGREFDTYLMSATISSGKASFESVGSASRESSSAVNGQSYKNLTGKMLEIKTSVDGLTVTASELSGNYSELKQTVDGLSAEVKKDTKITGGGNLILGSESFKNATYVGIDSSVVYGDDGSATITNANTCRGFKFNTVGAHIIEGVTLCMSVMYKLISGTDALRMGIAFKGDNGQNYIASIATEPRYRETVSETQDLRWALTPTGASAALWAEKTAFGAIVHGPAGQCFDWVCWGVQRGFEGVYADVSDAKYPEEENRGAALLDAAETEAAVSLPLTIEEAS